MPEKDLSALHERVQGLADKNLKVDKIGNLKTNENEKQFDKDLDKFLKKIDQKNEYDKLQQLVNQLDESEAQEIVGTVAGFKVELKKLKDTITSRDQAQMKELASSPISKKPKKEIISTQTSEQDTAETAANTTSESSENLNERSFENILETVKDATKKDIRKIDKEIDFDGNDKAK